jgi:anti-sigma factor ChrR (cupin superfamily)
VKWEPHTKFSNHSHWGGEEIYILRGTLFDEFGVYKKGTWIRSPHMSSHNPYTTNDGALIFVKTGHIHE